MLKETTFRVARRVVATGVAICSLAGASVAQDLRYSFPFAETFSPFPAVERFVKQLSDEANVDARLFVMSLLSPAETMAGLRDGIADIAWTTLTYNPTEFSESTLINDLSMQITAGDAPEIPGAAMVGATLEYILLNCPDCLVQMAEQNAVMTAATGTPPYYLICGNRIESVADVKGKRIRIAGGNFGRWAENFGGTGVSLPGNEIYESISQGVIDCTSNDMSQLSGLQLSEVAKSVTTGVPGGVYAAIGRANFNRNAWKALSEKQRAAVLRAAARFSADSSVEYYKAEQRARDVAAKANIEIIAADAELMEATAKFVEGDVATVVKQYSEQYGLANAEAKVATASGLINKWKSLFMGVPADVDAIEALYWEHIYSKIDVATYGMD
jgi:TRAP-type transport system periplasmic protein